MPVLLSDAAAAKWTLGHTRSQVGEVSISPVTGTSLQLLPRDRMGDITTPFEPSAFQGTGDEVRKGVLFSVPDDVYAGIAAIETWVQGALEEPYAIWNPRGLRGTTERPSRPRSTSRGPTRAWRTIPRASPGTSRRTGRDSQ